jgi:hypothetical protein
MLGSARTIVDPEGLLGRSGEQRIADDAARRAAEFWHSLRGHHMPVSAKLAEIVGMAISMS